MQMPKEIKNRVFLKFRDENERIRYKCHAEVVTVAHERMYLIDLTANENYSPYNWDVKKETSKRILISKKQKDYVVFSQGKGKAARTKTDEFLECYNYIDMTDETTAVLEKLLGEDKELTFTHRLVNLLTEYHDLQRDRIRKNSGYIDDETVYECPNELPGGLLEYIRNRILPEDKTLIYKKGNAQGVCAACGEHVRAADKRFTQSSLVNCPNCGTEVRCVLENSNVWRADYVNNVIVMQKDNKGKVWFRQFHILRDNEAKYENLERYIDEIARYVIVSHKTAAWRNEAKVKTYIGICPTYRMKTWERYNSCNVYDSEYKFYCEDIESTVEGTVLQYAELEKYIEVSKHAGNNIVKYCRYFAKFPVMEFLFKKGFYRVISDKIKGNGLTGMQGIYWERDKLKECFKFPLRLLNLYEPGEWTMRKINDCRKLYRLGLTDNEIKTAMECGFDYETYTDFKNYVSISKTLKYLNMQKSDTRTYRDYLRDCIKLKYDMKSKAVLFPKNLETAHMHTIELIKYERVKGLEDKFKKVYKSLQKKAFAENELIIRPAKSAKELICEGAALHHCVGGYAQSMADGKTAIFLIRKAAEAEKPYFTLEFKGDRVVQCRTLNNRSYETEENVKIFVGHWLDSMRKGA